MTSGQITLNGISDPQVAKVFEFKTAHEGQFVVSFNSQPIQQGNQPPTYNSFNISWANDAGLKLVLELVGSLLP